MSSLLSYTVVVQFPGRVGEALKEEAKRREVEVEDLIIKLLEERLCPSIRVDPNDIIHGC